MITVKAEGTMVVVKVESGIPVEKNVFNFYWETGTEWGATLLAQSLSDTLGKTISRIRKLEYESGYSDAKKKKSKRDWFWNRLIDKIG